MALALRLHRGQRNEDKQGDLVEADKVMRKLMLKAREKGIQSSVVMEALTTLSPIVIWMI